MTSVWVIAAIAAFMAVAWLLRRNARRDLQREFEAREFETSAGRLRGRDLRVVRYRFERLGGGENSAGQRTGWWYCVAPGPCWLLVIGQDALVSMARSEMKWIARELSEERMRGALAGDAAALNAAFEGVEPAERTPGRTAG